MGLKFLVTLCGIGCLVGTSLAAIHPYNKEYFYAVGDAFIFRGGREGLYASTKEASLLHSDLSKFLVPVCHVSSSHWIAVSSVHPGAFPSSQRYSLCRLWRSGATGVR